MQLIKSPRSGVTLFPVSFRRVRRNDFSLSRQNRLSYILDILGKE